jgi:hypothetical protein
MKRKRPLHDTVRLGVALLLAIVFVVVWPWSHSLYGHYHRHIRGLTAVRHVVLLLFILGAYSCIGGVITKNRHPPLISPKTTHGNVIFVVASSNL